MQSAPGQALFSIYTNVYIHIYIYISAGVDHITGGFRPLQVRLCRRCYRHSTCARLGRRGPAFVARALSGARAGERASHLNNAGTAPWHRAPYTARRTACRSLGCNAVRVSLLGLQTFSDRGRELGSQQIGYRCVPRKSGPPDTRCFPFLSTCLRTMTLPRAFNVFASGLRTWHAARYGLSAKLSTVKRKLGKVGPALAPCSGSRKAAVVQSSVGFFESLPAKAPMSNLILAATRCGWTCC